MASYHCNRRAKKTGDDSHQISPDLLGLASRVQRQLPENRSGHLAALLGIGLLIAHGRLACRMQAARVATQTNPYKEMIMTSKVNKRWTKSAAFAIASGLLAVGSSARADETAVVTRAAPDTTSGLYNAFEIGVAFGYLQGIGDVGDGVRSLTDSGGPGISGEVDLGWRINPNWLVGVYGTTGWLPTGDSSGDAHNNWTTSAGVQGAYHFMPGNSFDPWVSLGAGWRGYFVNRPSGRDARHGIEFARLQVGVDIPVQPGIAISPYIGASGTLFLTQQLAEETSFNDIQNRQVNVFLNAGVMARFDVLGGYR